MSGSRGTFAFVAALFVGSMALSDAFCGSPSLAAARTRARQRRRQPRQFARHPSSNSVEVAMLSGEAAAIGVVVAGVATAVASRGFSTLAGAFRLADYRTTSGHDLRLDDETLQSNRRRIVQASELSPPLLAPSLGSNECATGVGTLTSDEDAPSLSGSEADMMDWREQIRQASQLPGDVAVGLGSAILGDEEPREEGADYGAVADDDGDAGL